jgi:hypothetical protein
MMFKFVPDEFVSHSATSPKTKNHEYQLKLLTSNKPLAAVAFSH